MGAGENDSDRVGIDRSHIAVRAMSPSLTMSNFFTQQEVEAKG